MPTTLQPRISISNICKTSTFTALGMISYFFLMKIFHLTDVAELRFLNFFIVFFGVRKVLLHKQTRDGGKLDYLPCMMVGFMSVFFSAAMFSTFVFVYLNLDPEFMHHLHATQFYGRYLTPASSALVTFLEGVASGSIVTFIVMRTMKKDRSPVAEEQLSQLVKQQIN